MVSCSFWGSRYFIVSYMQKKQKKVPGLFGSYPEKPLSLHPLRERNTTPKHKNRFWKILKKVPKSFGDSEKWLTFAPASNKTERLKRCEKRFWKNSEKFFQKDLVVQKIWLIFAPLSAEKSRSGQWGKPKGGIRQKERNCSL